MSLSELEELASAASKGETLDHCFEKHCTETHGENFKTLWKGAQVGLKKWKDILIPLDKVTQHSKMSLLPKLIYKFNTTPIKIPRHVYGVK